MLLNFIMKQDFSVGEVSGFKLYDPERVGILFTVTMLRLSMRSIQPSADWISGSLSSGVKGLEGETDHLSPTCVKVKNA
jgi:hypothetical protein